MNAAEHLLGPGALGRHGARVALVCDAESLGYRALAERVARSAEALRSLGIRPGERVLMLMRDTPLLAAAWLGALRSGAVAVALNTKLSEEEYRHVLDDSAARLALVEDVFIAARPDLAAELAREKRLAVAGGPYPGAPRWEEQLARAGTSAPAYPARPDEPAFWLYSSGTTGRPKGIVHVHGSVPSAGQVLRETAALAPGELVLATSKLFFAYGLENALLGPLALGLGAILYPEWPEAGAVRELVARHRPAAFFSVPSFYRRLLALPGEALQEFRAVRHFYSAGERLPEAIAAQWLQRTGREILSIYGMSETFCVAMVTPPGTHGGPRGGKPLAGVETRLLGADGREVADGEPGVLWLRHPALSSGYANRPEQTREQFRDGWFCTRDVFVRDAAGWFSHRGRSDDMIKVAGQWVQPGELEEAALAEPGIADAACVAVSDAQGFERLALFIAAREAPEAAALAAERACEAKLPRHKRPRWVRVVAELPRTATGKVQRFKLREMMERELRAKD